MASTPRFTIATDKLPQALRELRHHEINLTTLPPQQGMEGGAAQIWECSDSEGHLFLVSTQNVRQRNALGIEPGNTYIEIGPRQKGAVKRPRKQVSCAFETLERVLLESGARRFSPTKGHRS